MPGCPPGGDARDRGRWLAAIDPGVMLEDAGCTDAKLLGHLRVPGPLVRGCRAVDLVLGKE